MGKVGLPRWLLAAALALAVGCTRAPPPAAVQEPALWRISDADSEIWLYGTVHALHPGEHWRGPRFEQAFDSSGELIIETDVSPQAQPRFDAVVQRQGALAPGETLSAQLSPDARAALARVTAATHLDAAKMEHERPWLAALQLTVASAASHGQAANAGVEPELLRLAQRRRMNVSFLETPEQQVLTLADLPRAEETHFLESTLREIEAGDATDQQMENAWAVGDTATLWRLLSAQFHDAGPAVYDALITRRNAVWADEITRRLNGSGHIFIAVGAAHLAGPDGVVALLRARGVHVDGPAT